MRKQFGGKITNTLKERYAQSKQWNGKQFLNLEHTSMDIGFAKLLELLYKQFFERKGKTPKEKISILPLERERFLSPVSQPKFIWYGHSVVLLRMADTTILIDPMLGPDAAPISPIGVKRFSEGTLDLIKDFPEIDLLLLTHDHYDHLDWDSVRLLMPKVKQYYVALGVSRHLEKWGVAKTKIKEFDWWSTSHFQGIDLTFTPTRHFSGRGLTDRAKSLWGGWVLKTSDDSLYFSGDSGYGKHFKEVGEKLGPFNFAFMECGQYNQNWHQIHMFPEETVQAALDVHVQTIMPVHWAGFALAQHHWKDPFERFISACEKAQQAAIVPRLGELVDLNALKDATPYWKALL